MIINKFDELIKKLEKEKVEYNLIILRKPAITTEEVKEQVSTESSICKTLILKNSKGGLFSAMLLGEDKIDFKKVSSHFNEKKLSIAKKEDIKKLGFSPGSVCPATAGVPLVVDDGVMSREWINFGSGDLSKGIEVRSSDLRRIADFKIDDIKA